jgi:hypothetical protein
VSNPGRRDEFAATEVIRPAAVLMEREARAILAGLATEDVHHDGNWVTSPGVWQRWDQPWLVGARDPGRAVHLGTIRSIYDSPQRYFVTIFRASITAAGIEAGWTIERLCDDALKHADLTLAECPRATLFPLPEPFRLDPANLSDHQLPVASQSALDGEPDAEPEQDRPGAAVEHLAEPRPS